MNTWAGNLWGWLTLAVVISFNISNHSSAATLYVNLNSTNATPPYADWSTAATNIQDAIDAANAGDFIVVSNGIYRNGGRVVYGSETNRVVLDKAVTVQSVNGAAVTVIQGDFETRCVYLTNGAALNGFTLTNGRTFNSLNVVYDQSGAGVWCESSSALVTNCLFTGNVAEHYGGGAFQGTIWNCVFTNNTADFGGAACSNVLFNCSIVQNKAQSSGENIGGGGAYYCTLSNCLVVGNQSLGGEGGGAAYSTLTNCLISQSFASGYGGGSYSCLMFNCILTGNTARDGGADFLGTLNNCVVTSNTANVSGGGCIYSTLNNCTLTGNSSIYSGGGGGMYGGSADNSILYNNGINNYVGAALNYCCTTPLPAGPGNITNDPAFVNPAGGDFHLQSISPCINAGNNAYVTNSTDLDGNPRIAGGTVDIGAYEYQTPSSVLSYAWAQQYGLPTDGTADYADTDGTGMNNWQKWIAGLDPTNPASVLAMQIPVVTNTTTGVVVSWQSVNTRTYYLQRATDLTAQPAFSAIQSNLLGQSGTTSYTDTTATNGGPYFYRVGVQ